MSQLITDFNAGGHHATYIANLVRQGYRGHVLISTDIKNELAPDILEAPGVELHHVPTKGHDAEAQVTALMDYLDRHPQITDTTHLVIDEVFKALIRRLPSLIARPRRHISGVWLMSNLFYDRHDGLKNRLRFIRFYMQIVAYLLVARRANLYFLNEELAAYLRAKAPFVKKRIHDCPDPVDSATIAMGQMPPPQNEVPTILFMGKHSVRKGTYWAIDTILKDWKTPMHIIVAGDTSGDARIASLKEKNHPCVTIEWLDRRLSEEEIVACYKRADLVVTPYQRYGGSSGIFNNAVALNKPLLVSDWGLLASRTRAHNAGLTFTPHSEDDLRNKLQQMITSLPWQQNEPAVQAFLAYHNPTMLYQHIISPTDENAKSD